MNPGKKLLIAALVVIAAAVGSYIIFRKDKPAEPLPQAAIAYPIVSKIGESVEGRIIEAYSYGAGARKIAFVGGIHGGYEWNSVALAYRFMDYLKANPGEVPAGLAVTVIPDLNPDAVFKVTGKEGRFDESDVSKDPKLLASARFNANAVDLNRNFDCSWQATSTWQTKKVSAGTAPFSEPEAAAFRDFVADRKPDAVVFWHSQANTVYSSQCGDGILPLTLDMMKAYAKASGYNAAETFDSYAVTGAAEDWLASQKIPAITVELKTHQDVEWEKNLAGIKALLRIF